MDEFITKRDKKGESKPVPAGIAGSSIMKCRKQNETSYGFAFLTNIKW